MGAAAGKRARTRGGLWKWVGLAGVAGVAATGAVVVRAERQRRAYTPDDVRTRLRDRARELDLGQHDRSEDARDDDAKR